MKNENNNKDALKNLVLISQVGISIVTPILLGVYIGQFVDRRIGTNGFFAILFIIIGAAAGFLNIFKLAESKNNKRKWIYE